MAVYGCWRVMVHAEPRDLANAGGMVPIVPVLPIAKAQGEGEAVSAGIEVVGLEPSTCALSDRNIPWIREAPREG